MTDKERITELETGLMKAFEMISQLSFATVDVTDSLKADQAVIEEMVMGLWQREGVEPVDAWMDAEDRLKEQGR